MYYVYVLYSNKDKRLYIGYSSRLKERIVEHKSRRVISTKNRLPVKLIYYESYLDKRDAKGREKFLKGGSGHKYLYKQLVNFFKKAN